MSLNLLSLNVNGLRDNRKRQTLFHWIKSKNVDICLLQETHVENVNEMNMWTKQWGGKAFWSAGTQASRGVACLVKCGLDINFSKVEKDTDGSYLRLDFKIDELNISLINVYAPNVPADRKNFFTMLHGKLYEIQNNDNPPEIMLGGDFNCVQYPPLDRRNERG